MKARESLHSFFTEVLRCRDSSAPADLCKGLQLLQDLHEPNETRLGETAEGSRGRGFGPEMGELLWKQLQIPVCKSAALSKLEDLPIFVEGVGKDLISDMTTRVIFGVLVEYTQEMMKIYPSLAKNAVTRTVRLWNLNTLDWQEHDVLLPFADGLQLLLVPVDWVRGNVLMASSSFYNLKATQTLQIEQTVTLNDVKVKPSKRLLKKQNPKVKKLNGSQTVVYLRDHGRNLVDEFREDLDRGFEPMTPEAARRRIDRHKGKAA